MGSRQESAPSWKGTEIEGVIIGAAASKESMTYPSDDIHQESSSPQP